MPSSTIFLIALLATSLLPTAYDLLAKTPPASAQFERLVLFSQSLFVTVLSVLIARWLGA